MTSKRQRLRLAIITSICILSISACRSGQLSESGIARCLTRTDFAGHRPAEREAISWHIGYAHKVRETTCCALEPQSSLLAKRKNLPALKGELLSRIEILEGKSDAEERVRQRVIDPCYAAFMDLYHEISYAERPR